MSAAAELAPTFWAVDAGEVASSFGVEPARGLSEAEAAARLAEHGPNELRRARVVSGWRVLGNQLKSIIVVLLLAAAVVSVAIGELLEGAAIGGAIALTVALGFFSELRAVRSMEALRALGAVSARVRRDGVEREIPAAELVPGDVVVFEAGDRVTADLRVVSGSRLQADESVLTGESVPVGKSPAPVDAGATLADRSNQLFKGTAVVRGSGEGVVVATGMATEIGHIATLVAETADEETPLERQLAEMGRKLLWLCLGVAAITAAVGTLGGRSLFLMIETGVALAVAAIPEGLPVVATMALARGMWRLATRHALIKRLSAVETLGATSVIVADKTGTLTANRLSVVAVVVDGEPVDDLAAAPRAALEIAALCNNATLDGDKTTGDPLEIALLRAADAAGLTREAAAAAWPEVREEAFDPATKMMATVHRAAGGYRVLAKGAPEAILAVSTATPAEREAALERSEAMAAEGLRVLALADKLTADPAGEVYADLELAALIGFADPPRPEVIEPIARCRDAGIRVVMATGDQPATAAYIADAVGLDSTSVLHGGDLDERLGDDVLSGEVFARVTPQQKLDIICAHQAAGAVVAMTGDGVNDAPALRRADIGIAMGERGTDVAREAADMVLVDDSFASIVAAVEQGRAIFANIRRFVVYLLSCNLSEILVVTGAVVFGAPLPLLPLQILFLNLVTDVFPALALGFGAGDPTAMKQPPRRAREPIVAGRHWLVITGYAILITGAVLGAMSWALAGGASAAQATSVSFLTLGFAQLWHVFNLRDRRSRLLSNDVVGNPWIWGALGLCAALMIAAATWPPLARVLGVAAIGAGGWIIVLIASLTPLVVVQAVLVLRKETS